MTKPAQPASWRIGAEGELSLDRARIMGVLNVTPDSFSDGGLNLDPSRAVARALQMIDEGASIIDVGGESTRPGARRMPAHTQRQRVAPVIRRLAAQSAVAISIDTTLSEVAKAALDHGASIINDVSACTEDPAMAALAAERGCGLVLMHRLHPPQSDSYSDQYKDPPRYDDVVGEMRTALGERVRHVTEAGVEHQRIVIDPGLGFGKTMPQNFELIRRFEEIAAVNGRAYPLLSACSRKSFIGRASGVDEPERRVAGTLAVSIAHWLRGVRLFRVHDVRVHREAFEVLEHVHAPRRRESAEG